MPSFIDLTGQKFGKLTVVKRAENVKRKVYWDCVCECGESKTIVSSSIIGGHTKSCGCLKAETIGNIRATHRMSNTTEYNSWRAMVERCTNQKYRYYHEYGGRGIKICDRWKSFANFISDMGEKPSPKHSIDRIDVDGNYEPSNCKWSSQSEQCKNRRTQKSNKSGTTGVYYSNNEKRWIAQITHLGNRIRLGRFKNKNDAIKSRKEAELKYWGKSS